MDSEKGLAKNVYVPILGVVILVIVLWVAYFYFFKNKAQMPVENLPAKTVTETLPVENPAIKEATANPFENVKTNPFEDVQYNPFE